MCSSTSHAIFLTDIINLKRNCDRLASYSGFTALTTEIRHCQLSTRSPRTTGDYFYFPPFDPQLSLSDEPLPLNISLVTHTTPHPRRSVIGKIFRTTAIIGTYL